MLDSNLNKEEMAEKAFEKLAQDFLNPNKSYESKKEAFDLIVNEALEERYDHKILFYCKNDKITFFHMAAYYGNKTVFEKEIIIPKSYLVKKRPLPLNVKFKHIKIKKNTPNNKALLTKEGFTILEYGVLSKNLECINFILRAYSIYKEFSNNQLKIINPVILACEIGEENFAMQILQSNSHLLKLKSKPGNSTPLVYSIQHGLIELFNKVKFHTYQSSDLNFKNSSGENCLSLAIKSAYKKGECHFLKKIILDVSQNVIDKKITFKDNVLSQETFTSVYHFLTAKVVPLYPEDRELANLIEAQKDILIKITFKTLKNNSLLTENASNISVNINEEDKKSVSFHLAIDKLKELTSQTPTNKPWTMKIDLTTNTVQFISPSPIKETSPNRSLFNSLNSTPIKPSSHTPPVLSPASNWREEIGGNNTNVRQGIKRKLFIDPEEDKSPSKKLRSEISSNINQKNSPNK
ncbi:MAG: hypothetical protein J0H68_03740 [Sphingobacteriia bacterium]|nr:hypothetical protein [Sphingobacteriia bacterium]